VRPSDAVSRIFPVVVGEILTPSLAIIKWLDETHPEPPLLPADAMLRAKACGFAQVVACDIHPLQNLRVLDCPRTQHRRAEWHGSPVPAFHYTGGAGGRVFGPVAFQPDTRSFPNRLVGKERLTSFTGSESNVPGFALPPALRHSARAASPFFD